MRRIEERSFTPDLTIAEVQLSVGGVGKTEDSLGVNVTFSHVFQYVKMSATSKASILTRFNLHD